MSFSFIHAADIHLGRPFSGLDRYCENPKFNSLYKKALKKSFDNLIDFAIKQDVDFLLIAGDTFDSNQADFESKLILKEGLKKLESGGIKVYLICGNHDPLDSYNKNTFNFSKDSIVKIVGLNSNWVDKFIITNKNSEPVALLQAISFKNTYFSENPAKYLTYPSVEEKKLFNITMLHCDLDGAQDSLYAPVAKSELEGFNFDYYALGHIHCPNIKEDSKIQYCGTLQGRNTKETGSHGVRYIKVENNKIIENSFKPLDTIRYEDIEIDISCASDIVDCASIISDCVSNISDSLCEMFLVRVNLCGGVNFFSEINEDFFEKVCENIESMTKNRIYISKFYNNTTPKIDSKLLLEDEGIAGMLYKTALDGESFEKVFLDIETRFQKFISCLNLSTQEYLEWKSEIQESVSKICTDISAKLYANEIKED